MAQNKLSLSKKEHVLLANSQIVEDYPWLKAFLLVNDRIDELSVNNLPDDQKNFFHNMVQQLIKQATSEWEGIGDCPVDDLGPNNKGNWIKCSLCGTKNRWIYYIENKINHKKLNVGSECIKEFGIEVTHAGMTVEQLKKQATVIRLTNKLNEKFPGIKSLISGWNYKIKSYPIMIPYEYERPYIDLGEKANKLFKGYLEQKFGDEVSEELGIIFDEQFKHINTIEQYVKDNSSDRFSPSKDIERWLESHYDRAKALNTLKMLKTDGKITWKTAHRIEEPNFMDELIVDFNKHLISIGLEIETRDNDQRGYVVKPVKSNCKFLLRHDNFVLNYGGLIFGEEIDFPLNIEALIKMFKVYDEKSYYILLAELQTLVNGKGVQLMDSNFKLNEIKVYEQSTDRYLITDFKNIVENFKGLALGVNSQTSDDLVKYINSLDAKRYTKDELKKFEVPRWLFTTERY